MRLSRLAALIPLVLLFPGPVAYGGATAPRHSEPVLTERVSSELLQIRMEVSGPADELFRVDPDDFEVWTGKTPVKEFRLERILEAPADPYHTSQAEWSTWTKLSEDVTATGAWIQSAHPSTQVFRRARSGSWSRSGPAVAYGTRTIPSLLSLELPVDERGATPTVRVVSRRKHLAIRLQNLDADASAPDSREAGTLSASLMPTLFEDGEYRGLIQVFLDGERAGGSWELQASVIGAGGSTAVWGHVVPQVAQRRFALQDMIEIRPGRYDIVAHARHRQSGETLTAEFSGELPRPRTVASVAGDVTLMQPAKGAFLRSGHGPALRGYMVVAPGEPVVAGQPLALLTTICRDAARKKPAMARRAIVGVSAVRFPPTLIEEGGDRCVLIQDLIPADVLGAGTFEYRVAVRQRGEADSGSGKRFHVKVAGEMPPRVSAMTVSDRKP